MYYRLGIFPSCYAAINYLRLLSFGEAVSMKMTETENGTAYMCWT